MENGAEFAPAGTRTEAGTDATAAFELDRLTVAPPAGAGPLSTTCAGLVWTLLKLSVVATAPELGSTIRPLSSTTSKFGPNTWPSVCRVVSFQRESGAPVRYQDEPLSANRA